MDIRVYQIPSERMDSNSYLVEKDGHVIIIDGSSYEGIRREIGKARWQVDYLLLTHEHFDHIWFLEDLRRDYRMPVVACRLCSQRIRDVKANLSNIADILYYFKTGIVREGKSPSFTCGPADIVFENDCELQWQGCRFRFRRLPGHSPASTIITLEAGEEPVRVFTGDYLIQGEEEILRLKDGSPEDYETFARPVLEKIPAGTIICPGHGPVYEMGPDPSE